MSTEISKAPRAQVGSIASAGPIPTAPRPPPQTPAPVQAAADWARDAFEVIRQPPICKAKPGSASGGPTVSVPRPIDTY